MSAQVAAAVAALGRRYAASEVSADGSFARIARIAATVFDAPIATVSVLDEDGVCFAATYGLDGVRQVGPEAGLCTSAVLEAGPYVVNDAVNDSRTVDHPLVRGEFGLRFYVAAPIVLSTGQALGTVNVIDREARPAAAVTPGQLVVLTDLAGAVADLLEIRLAALDAIRTERDVRRDETTRRRAADKLAGRIREATDALRGQERPDTCQLGAGVACPEPAVIKVADSWGDSAWGCAVHGEDALINVPSVFLAAESSNGLATYMDRRTAPRPGAGSPDR